MIHHRCEPGVVGHFFCVFSGMFPMPKWVADLEMRDFSGHQIFGLCRFFRKPRGPHHHG